MRDDLSSGMVLSITRIDKSVLDAWFSCNKNTESLYQKAWASRPEGQNGAEVTDTEPRCCLPSAGQQAELLK